MRSRLKTALPAVLTAAAVVAAWQLFVAASGIEKWLLPAPSDIGVALWANAGLLAHHTWPTL
ncbi:MAG TPA: ABC transporter permease, partial [Bacillales bacterium]|nr:ABC transporter permease [Bacillales bacterium]